MAVKILPNFTFNQEGNHFNFKNDTGKVIPAGSLIWINRLAGVTKKETPIGGCGTAMVKGVYRAPFDPDDVVDTSVGVQVAYDEATGYVTKSGKPSTQDIPFITVPKWGATTVVEAKSGLQDGGAAVRAGDTSVFLMFRPELAVAGIADSCPAAPIVPDPDTTTPLMQAGTDGICGGAQVMPIGAQAVDANGEVETAKDETAKVETAKVETAKDETPNVETAKVETSEDDNPV